MIDISIYSNSMSDIFLLIVDHGEMGSIAFPHFLEPKVSYEHGLKITTDIFLPYSSLLRNCPPLSRECTMLNNTDSL